MSNFQNPTIKESVTKLVDQGHDTVDAIKSKVSDVRAQVGESGSSFGERISTYVSAHPFKAIGIAFGLGYVAMRIRTSPLIDIAFLGAFGYGVSKVIGVRSPDAVR